MAAALVCRFLRMEEASRLAQCLKLKPGWMGLHFSLPDEELCDTILLRSANLMN